MRHNRRNLLNFRSRKPLELGWALKRQHHRRYLIKVEGAEGAEPSQPKPVEELALERIPVQFLRREEIAFRYDFLKADPPCARALPANC